MEEEARERTSCTSLSIKFFCILWSVGHFWNERILTLAHLSLTFLERNFYYKDPDKIQKVKLQYRSKVRERSWKTCHPWTADRWNGSLMPAPSLFNDFFFGAWQRLTFPFPFVHHQSLSEIHYPVFPFFFKGFLAFNRCLASSLPGLVFISSNSCFLLLLLSNSFPCLIKLSNNISIFKILNVR